MADTYVYYFTVRDARTGAFAHSKRRATLEAIERSKGEPVLESQLEVDGTEVDSNGFLVRSFGGSHSTDELWGQIRSLNLRAIARDREALQLDQCTQGPLKYMLSLESRELRKQAGELQQKRTDVLAAELGKQREAPTIEQFGCSAMPD
jgi:hypothetical protein